MPRETVSYSIFSFLWVEILLFLPVEVARMVFRLDPEEEFPPTSSRVNIKTQGVSCTDKQGHS